MNFTRHTYDLSVEMMDCFTSHGAVMMTKLRNYTQDKTEKI